MVLTGTAILVAASLLFVGCRNAASPPTGNETGFVSLSIQGLGRTILPGIPSGFDRFVLTFTGGPGGPVVATWDDPTPTWINHQVSGLVQLAVGTWDLTVTAYEYDDDYNEYLVMMMGTMSGINVVAGVITPATVTIAPIVGGQGTFSWDISIDPAIAPSVATGTMEVRNLAGITVWGPRSIIAPGGYYYYYIALPAGQYRVLFTLVSNSPTPETTVITEILRVYQNMDSHAERVFNEGIFPIALLHRILGAWNGTTWDFASAGIQAGHFGLLDNVVGVTAGNFDTLTGLLNTLTPQGPTPVIGTFGLDELRVLIDAALIGVANATPAFTNAIHANWETAESAIEALVATGTGNNSPVTFGNWVAPESTAVPVSIGPYTVTVTFANRVPPPITYDDDYDAVTISLSGDNSRMEADISNLDTYFHVGTFGTPSFEWRRVTAPGVSDLITTTTTYYYVLQVADAGHEIYVIVTLSGYYGQVESNRVTAPVFAYITIRWDAAFHSITANGNFSVNVLTNPTVTIAVADADEYDGIYWFLNGTPIASSAIGGDYGEILTFGSAIHENREGTFHVTVEVIRDGVRYSLVIPIVVE